MRNGTPTTPSSSLCDAPCLDEGKCSGYCAGDGDPIRHTGFGDCACFACWPPEPDYPLADHGKPLGLWRSLWVVPRGARFYG